MLFSSSFFSSSCFSCFYQGSLIYEIFFKTPYGDLWDFCRAPIPQLNPVALTGPKR